MIFRRKSGMSMLDKEYDKENGNSSANMNMNMNNHNNYNTNNTAKDYYSPKNNPYFYSPERTNRNDSYNSNYTNNITNTIHTTSVKSNFISHSEFKQRPHKLNNVYTNRQILREIEENDDESEFTYKKSYIIQRFNNSTIGSSTITNNKRNILKQPSLKNSSSTSGVVSSNNPSTEPKEDVLSIIDNFNNRRTKYNPLYINSNLKKEENINSINSSNPKNINNSNNSNNNPIERRFSDNHMAKKKNNLLYNSISDLNFNKLNLNNLVSLNSLKNLKNLKKFNSFNSDSNSNCSTNYNSSSLTNDSIKDKNFYSNKNTGSSSKSSSIINKINDKGLDIDIKSISKMEIGYSRFMSSGK